MTAERRYDEKETASIIERASLDDEEGEPTGETGKGSLVPGSSSDGLTLVQLQEIGAELGIPAERIERAARLVENRRSAPPVKTFLGAARSVARIVPIPRPMDEDEWSRLVVMLRETFGAEGRIRVHGNLRSWNNGNLQAHVEPDGEGYRVRLQTVRGDVVPRAALGVMAMIASAVIALSAGVGDGAEVPIAAAIMALAGLAQVGYARALLPGWAAERAAQMEALSARIPRLLKDPGSGPAD